MKVNKIGITRIVIEFSSFVVKIPRFTYSWEHFLKGIVASINENKTWKYNSGKYERGYSHLLCPVLWCSWGGWILIMKKVDYCLTYRDYDKFNISKHKKHFKGDDTVSNYGILQGKLVKLDYGQ